MEGLMLGLLILIMAVTVTTLWFGRD